MKKRNILRNLFLITIMMCSCSPKSTEPTDIETKEESNESKKSKETEIEFRTLKVDGYYDDAYDSKGSYSNYTYNTYFRTPILITNNEGKENFKKEYEEFIEHRESYLDAVNLATNNILLFSICMDGGYYNFQPLKMYLENDRLRIYYFMEGEEEGVLHDTMEVFTHAIIEVPTLDSKVEKVYLTSELGRWDLDNAKIKRY